MLLENEKYLNLSYESSSAKFINAFVFFIRPEGGLLSKTLLYYI